QLKIKLLLNATKAGEEEVTYTIGCEATQADEARFPGGFTSATNCTKDYMAVSKSPATWTLLVGDGIRTHRLNLRQAMQQGYTFLTDGNNVIFQASFGATGVATYKQDNQILYTVALKLTYGPPERRLTVESRLICAPGPATCNSTHMTTTIPAFPGTLTGISLENRNIPMNQLQMNGIALDTRRGVKLHISKSILKSRLYSENCEGTQSYLSSLKLSFSFHGEMATMTTYPECPSALCTQEGYMDFEILGDSTKPTLDLNTLRLRDPTCKPIFKSPSGDMVQFHVPLNGCGTRQRFEGERTIYENEVSALWADLPPRWISRDSEFRLTVVCYYSSDDTLLNVKISSLPSPAPAISQGPLSLIILIYPDEAYIQPYKDDQYPVVKHLRQPIFLEVQVLNRNDPNIKLMLDDCWATMSLDPAAQPRWNIVVNGCNYDLDNYQTVFHSMGPSVSYPNFRQRFEVKTFAFVSDGRALPNLVYFHCSALICDRLQADSPLCSTRCPPSSRSRRALVDNSAIATLPGPILLVPDNWPTAQGIAQALWLMCIA
uniref:Zona pellucida glycoprotein 2 n=1 Tax=Sphenodon punctatus TaxID=8508 RepID=A0A8D0GH75_SPHPU